MAGTTDKIKGRAKVAAGAVSGDRSLENEGRIDRWAGEAKDTLAEASRTLETWLGKTSEQAGGWVRTTQRSVENWIGKLQR